MEQGVEGLSPIAEAQFDIEPPESFRKSTYFNFTLRLYGISHKPVQVSGASFISFLDNEARNGVAYSLKLADHRGEVDLFVRVVDSHTQELVRFESSMSTTLELDSCHGTRLPRVLLTHLALCSRCSQGKECGHRAQTPSDQVILGGFRIQFFLKCNLNCTLRSGYSSKSRRFQLVVSATEDMDILAISRAFFVHNSSKHESQQHGRQSKLPSTGSSIKSKEEPLILAISPSEGWVIGGQTIVIIGENFFEGLTVMFGACPAPSQFITRHAIRVRAPGHPPGQVEVTLALDATHFGDSDPGTFTFLEEEASLEQGLARLARLVGGREGDPARLPREILVTRAAEILETLCSSQEEEEVAEQMEEIEVDVEVEELDEQVSEERALVLLPEDRKPLWRPMS